MVLSFSGDEFLARRAARAALAERGVATADVREMGEGLDADALQAAASQGGLFGEPTLLLDFGAAFVGQGGVKPRNAVMKALAEVADRALIVVLDPSATPARQRSLGELGQHKHLPAPRFEQLPRWIAQELRSAGVQFGQDVPALLADTFGENPAVIASEVQKFAVLGGEYDADRVAYLVNRPLTHDSFDIVEAVAAGDAAKGVRVAGRLTDEGEAVPRIFGALVWQFLLVAKAVALISDGGGRPPSPSEAARALGAKPFVAQRTLALARKLDERDVLPMLDELLRGDMASKSGREPRLALASTIVALADRFRA